jgi:hypothetical protein
MTEALAPASVGRTVDWKTVGLVVALAWPVC